MAFILQHALQHPITHHKQYVGSYKENMHIESIQDIIPLMPSTTEDIALWTEKAITQFKHAIREIIAIDDMQRTYKNTIVPFDAAEGMSPLGVYLNLFYLIAQAHPEASLRDAAQKASEELNTVVVDMVLANKALYRAFRSYYDGNYQTEKASLTDAARYAIEEYIKLFEREGLNLPDDQLAHLANLRKKIHTLSQKFECAISQDSSTITALLEELEGMSPHILAQYSQENGVYMLRTDNPTYTDVMNNCKVEETRKRMCKAYNRRAYPENESILQELLILRDELAHILGYPNFAGLSLDNEMVKTTERAYEFLHNAIGKAQPKLEQEIAKLIQNLPPGVSLTHDGKIKPWDLAFIKNQFKKQFVDDQVIAQYFPVEKTIEGLLSIYEKFFSLSFELVTIPRLWHNDLMCLAVYDSSHEILYGYLILDLFPRPNKYSHAAHISIIHTTKTIDGHINPGLSTVLANFAKATADTPSLLPIHEVRTFFHEFGHALHALLGATELAGQSGTQVKRDFVEMPSQMLEEWLFDRNILHMVSGHYKTGEKLPDELIDNLLAIKNFESGYFVVRQVILSLIALDIYGSGTEKDTYTTMRINNEKYLPYVAFDSDNRFYTSWVHVPSYGPRYYGYLWSKVYALDLFNTIKQYGLLDPVIGQKYINEVIGRGGSIDPNIILFNFLGRAPSIDAFFKDMGL